MMIPRSLPLLFILAVPAPAADPSPLAGPLAGILPGVPSTDAGLIAALLTPEVAAAWLAAPRGLPLTPPPPRDRCERVAFIAWRAALEQAGSDYLLAVANCVNEGGGTWSCMRAALAEHREAVALAREQREAREDLCDELDEDGYAPRIDPADFSATIDNPFFPLRHGRTMVYRKVTGAGTEIIRVAVRPDTVEIAGVECTVVRDVVALDGVVIEDTDDWYAQDRRGNVWYFGEIAQNFEDGMLRDLGGSWTTGVDHAHPGYRMLARPRPGQVYREEFFLGEAEDAARVVRTDAEVEVPAGRFRGCLQTANFTPLEPDVLEQKFYAPGVGLVLEVDEDGGRTELIRIE